MSVTLATHCHSRDLPRLHAPGVLEELISCHGYDFDEILVVHQRCEGLTYGLPDGYVVKVLNVHAMDYPEILKSFGMNPHDEALDEITHGWDWQWYWQHHCVNHCKEIMVASGDYLVCNDADCRIISQPADLSWVIKAIEILDHFPEVFIVSPSDGGHEFSQVLPDGTRLTKTTSQQLFLGKTSELRKMDFTNLKWNGQFDAPYGPMQEWYGMFEGHLGRWMDKHNLYRAILPEQWRYWHSEWH